MIIYNKNKWNKTTKQVHLIFYHTEDNVMVLTPLAKWKPRNIKDEEVDWCNL